MVDTKESTSINGMSFTKIISAQDVILGAMAGNNEWFAKLIELGKLSNNTLTKAFESPLYNALNKEQKDYLKSLEDQAKDSIGSPGGKLIERAEKLGDIGELFINWGGKDNDGIPCDPFVKVPLSVYQYKWELEPPEKKGTRRTRSTDTIWVELKPTGPVLYNNKPADDEE